MNIKKSGTIPCKLSKLVNSVGWINRLQKGRKFHWLLEDHTALKCLKWCYEQVLLTSRIYGVAQSWTQLKWLSSSSSSRIIKTPKGISIVKKQYDGLTELPKTWGYYEQMSPRPWALGDFCPLPGPSAAWCVAHFYHATSSGPYILIPKIRG